MEDNIFDKIKKSSEESTEIQMPDGAMAEFRKYQSNRDAVIKPYATYIIIGTLFSLLIGTNIFWYLNQSDNSNLDTQTIQSNLATYTTSDTDTIYITNYLNSANENNAVENSPQASIADKAILTQKNNQLNSLKFTVDQLRSKLEEVKETINSKTPTYTKNRNTIISNPNNSNTNSNETITDIIIKRGIQNELEILEPISFSQLLINSEKLDLNLSSIIYIDTKKKVSFLESIRPKTFSLFSGAGLHIDKGNSLKNLSGRQFYLGFSTLFSSHYRGKLSLSISKSTGEIEDNLSIPDNLPTVMSPEGAILDELYISSRMASASVGLEYLFLPVKFFRPYAGLCYDIRKQQYTDIDYKYKLQDDELRLTADNSTTSINHHIGLIIGTDINLSRNFDAFINTTYGHGLSGNIKSIFQVNTGLQYHF